MPLLAMESRHHGANRMHYPSGRYPVLFPFDLS
jgi:hypothetical protein